MVNMLKSNNFAQNQKEHQVYARSNSVQSDFFSKTRSTAAKVCSAHLPEKNQNS